jgi:hypothetical protein
MGPRFQGPSAALGCSRVSLVVNPALVIDAKAQKCLTAEAETMFESENLTRIVIQTNVIPKCYTFPDYF